jgi:hypothetical protein
MYALIFDESDLIRKQEKVISLHRKRETAEAALEKRKLKLGRKVWECNTRIVWIDGSIKPGDFVTPGQYASWRPGEKVPHGEMYSDTD